MPHAVSPRPIEARDFRVDRDALPAGDYCSPGIPAVMLDPCFPHLTIGDPAANGWRYLRCEVPHNWYVDARFPVMGFMNRDEATLLHAIAQGFAGRRALEIGCWMGWSSCHLALGGVELDVIDPVLRESVHANSVADSIAAAGVAGRVRLHAVPSPEAVAALAAEGGRWSLFVIDGDHERAAPARDVEACLPHAEGDCAFVFHDLTSPDVADALRQLEAQGFLVLLYQTQQIMGVAWRGAFVPPVHVPDPAVFWQLPHHLVGFPVSGVSVPGFAVALRERLQEGDARIHELTAQIAAQQAEIERLRSWRSVFGRLRRLLG